MMEVLKEVNKSIKELKENKSKKLEEMNKSLKEIQEKKRVEGIKYICSRCEMEIEAITKTQRRDFWKWKS